jgi:hypothetical protein
LHVTLFDFEATGCDPPQLGRAQAGAIEIDSRFTKDNFELVKYNAGNHEWTT